jgi:hypothetical protein
MLALITTVLLCCCATVSAGGCPCWSWVPVYGHIFCFWPVRPHASTVQKKKHPAPLEGRGVLSFFLREFPFTKGCRQTLLRALEGGIKIHKVEFLMRCAALWGLWGLWGLKALFLIRLKGRWENHTDLPSPSTQQDTISTVEVRRDSLLRGRQHQSGGHDSSSRLPPQRPKSKARRTGGN